MQALVPGNAANAQIAEAAPRCRRAKNAYILCDYIYRTNELNGLRALGPLWARAKEYANFLHQDLELNPQLGDATNYGARTANLPKAANGRASLTLKDGRGSVTTAQTGAQSPTNEYMRRGAHVHLGGEFGSLPARAPNDWRNFGESKSPAGFETLPLRISTAKRCRSGRTACRRHSS